MGLKSKAELQLTKNRLVDVEGNIEMIDRRIKDKKTQLDSQKQVIEGLKSEIKEQQKEIFEKDNLIGDREKTIYNLNKRTQELEKFKFVLDYKIKDLKRDIAPREMEITKLRNDTNKMDESLKNYNNLNSRMGYIVDELRTKQEQMQSANKNFRAKIRENARYIQGFKNSVYQVVQEIDDFEILKLAVNDKLLQYVKGRDDKNVEIDNDIKKEFEHQQKYLDKSVAKLKKRLEVKTQCHLKDNLNIMNQNV